MVIATPFFMAGMPLEIAPEPEPFRTPGVSFTPSNEQHAHCAQAVPFVGPLLSEIKPRPRRREPTHREPLNAVDASWLRGEVGHPEWPMSEREPVTTPDPATMTLAELIASQPGPKTLDGQARLNPFRPIDTRRSEIPSEYTLAHEAGIPLYDIDGPVAGTTGVTLGESIADDFDGPAPFKYPDPRITERIELEQMTTKCGPVTQIRRKMHNGRDIVVINQPGTRMWQDRLADGSVVNVFQSPKPYNYRQTVDWYITRIREAHGYDAPCSMLTVDPETGRRRWASRGAARVRAPYPTLDEQRQMAEDGAEDRREATRPRLALADRIPFRGPDPDEMLHAPFEVVDVDDLLTDKAAVQMYGRALSDLWPEEAQELADTILARLRGRSRWTVSRRLGIPSVGPIVPVQITRMELRPDPIVGITRRFLRGHANWSEAVAAQQHIGSYLAAEVEIGLE